MTISSHSRRLGHLVVATCIVATSFAAMLVGSVALAAEPDPLDWTYWRGPEGNSISRETGLPDSIDPKSDNLLWSKDEYGGRSTPIVMRGKLYTLVRAEPGTASEGEQVLCLDAATGEKIWANRFNVWSSDVPDTRVGWSSVVGDPETGNIYALGVCGLFQCIDGETGETKWKVPLHEQFGLVSTYGGRTNFPVVFEDTVIIGAVIVGWGDMGVPAHRLLCFDKATGAVRWYQSTRLRPEDTIYSGPTLATIKGQTLLLTGSGDGWVYALQPRTGKKVWEFQLSRRGLNLSPTVVGETVYIGHNEENPTGAKVGAVVAINGALTGDITKSGELWREYEIDTGKASILALDNRLYCFGDAGKLFVLDAATGALIGKKTNLGTICHSTPLYADGKIYYLEKNGRWYVLTPDDKEGVKKPQRGKTQGDFPKMAGAGGVQVSPECWASPVVSHGRLYVQTTGALYCFEDKKKQHGSTPRPAAPVENDVAKDQTPAQLQIVPNEILMRPGDKAALSVRLYNAAGQFLKETTNADFSVEGPGKIDGATFVADDAAKHAPAFVTAKVGAVSGKNRIRVIPNLPWKFDFEGLSDAPATWVGVRYRHRVGKVDGSSALVKVTTIPRGTRSRCWFGHPDLHDYTVTAEMKPSLQDNKLPDFGLIAQGYKLAVEGETKNILITSWDSHDFRTRATGEFKMEANTWYALKLRVENSAGKALVQGKVWKRGEAEPDAWTIEIVDERPNVQGAPGMFGNATNAEIAIDNVAVVPN